MKNQTNISRRTMLKTAGAAGMGLAAVGASVSADEKPPKKPSIQFDNASFYDDKGEFQLDAGMDAYIEVMKFHGYPVYKDMRENLWVSDYGTGQFTKLGLLIKRRSPFRYTYVIGLGNDYIGYIPDAEAYDLGGYQVWMGLHSLVEKGTGERLVGEAVEMIRHVWRDSPGGTPRRGRTVRPDRPR